MAAPFRRSRIVLLTLAVVLTACQALGLGTSKPVVVISGPPSGSEFNVGQDVVVTSTSTDPQGITRVELLVDNINVRTDPSPVAQGQAQFQLLQTWKAAVIGTHTITVRAYNTTGSFAEGGIVVTVADKTGGAVSTPGPVETAVSPITLTAPTGIAPVPTAVQANATPSNTPAPTGCTSNSAFVADVTIPDWTVLAPGTAFTKTWRLQNNGTCAWDTSYAIMWVGGMQLAGQTAFPITPVAAGSTADVSIPLTAPTTPGSYTSVWRMRDSYGNPFGTDLTAVIRVPSPNTPTPTRTLTPLPGTPVISSFTCSPCAISPGQTATLSWGLVSSATSVTIDPGLGGVPTPGNYIVTPAATTTYVMTAVGPGGTSQATVTITVAPGSGTIYDFIARANVASWSSSAGALPFPGPSNDTRGFARWVNSPASKMEDGSTPSQCLETHPRWVTGGNIQGTYTDVFYSGYTVQSSDRFQAKFGFLNGAYSGPGTANVTFKVWIRPEGGPNTPLSVSHAYNNHLATMDWSLASWVGRRADFILEVDANNASASRDWACWVSARIVR